MRRNRSVYSIVLFAFFAVTLFAVNGLAVQLTVVNSDFEDQTTFTYYSESAPNVKDAEWEYFVPGWTSNPDPTTPFIGTDTLRMNNSILDAFGHNMAAGKGGFLTQDLLVPVVEGDIVTFKVMVGRRTDRAELDYSLFIYSGGIIVGQLDLNSGSIAVGTWSLQTLTTTIPLGKGGDLSIALWTDDQYSTNPPPRDHQVDFDNVLVYLNAPEPASVVLVGGGLLLAGLFGRKRLQK